jgi:hypothetical protein
MPAPSTGGVDLGSMGQLDGRVVGLHAFTNLATDATPALVALHMRRKAAKDHNDRPVPSTIGANDGQPVKDKPPVSWVPDW